MIAYQSKLLPYLYDCILPFAKQSWVLDQKEEF